MRKSVLERSGSLENKACTAREHESDSDLEDAIQLPTAAGKRRRRGSTVGQVRRQQQWATLSTGQASACAMP